MNKKQVGFIAFFAFLIIFIVACGGNGESVEVTRVVEVTRIVEVAGEAGAPEPITFAGGGDTLGTVQDRGKLICGVHGGSPGFAFVEEDGTISGFDWDFCRAVAAAVLGDSEAVQARPATSQERFPVLQSGEIDVLIRTTTWTISRDTAVGTNFAPTTFYDGQGMMVRADSGITDLSDFEGRSVCVSAGTTTEKNLADVFRSLGIDYESVVFDDRPAAFAAYNSGRCDGMTSDKSALIGGKTLMDNPDDHVILEVTMSKEPLGPVVRHGDDNWFDIVKWTVNCTFEAEELGITSANVDDMLGSDDPKILNVLGVEGDLGQAMGLNNSWCADVIRQVGNYAEIYNANLGPDTQYNVPRGVNNSWIDGGLLYSPPFR